MTFFAEYGFLFILGVCYCEYLNLPGFPAGIVMPGLGILAHQSRLNLFAALVVSICAGVLASLTLYAICRYGGAPLLDRLFGKSEKFQHLVRRSHEMIEKGGRWALFTSRLIPVLRTIVSIPAGLLSVPVRDYVLCSAAGIACWNTVFILLGYFGSDLVMGFLH